MNCYRDGFLEKPKTKRTYAKDLLEVEVGTNGYRGGDAGHGCTTYFRIEGDGDACIEVDHNQDGFEVALGGDWELSAIIEALEYIVDTLKEQIFKERTLDEEIKEALKPIKYLKYRFNNSNGKPEGYEFLNSIIDDLYDVYISLNSSYKMLTEKCFEKHETTEAVNKICKRNTDINLAKTEVLKLVYEIYKDLTNEHHQS